jgi:hypothetical protein
LAPGEARVRAYPLRALVQFGRARKRRAGKRRLPRAILTVKKNTLSWKEENAIRITYGRKTVTYLVDVRFFLGGGGGDKKSVTPKIRKFRFNWGSQWDAIQHVTEDHTALQTGTGDFVKIPKIGAISM